MMILIFLVFLDFLLFWLVLINFQDDLEILFDVFYEILTNEISNLFCFLSFPSIFVTICLIFNSFRWELNLILLFSINSSDCCQFFWLFFFIFQNFAKFWPIWMTICNFFDYIAILSNFYQFLFVSFLSYWSIFFYNFTKFEMIYMRLF